MSQWNLYLKIITFWILIFVNPGIAIIDPEDEKFTGPELIKKYGYPIEVHNATTPDGYILELHRIPHGKNEDPDQVANKKIAFLQHGLISSATDWIITGPGKALGYLLADRGYDVWMGNVRGNTYSKKHIKMKPSDSQFWDYSWHEIGITDLPTMIDYVLNKTGQKKLYYIGHSQGTTSFFVMCSEKPEYNEKIRLMVSLAPIAFMGNVNNPMMKLTSKLEKGIGGLLGLIGVHEFLPSNDFFAYARKKFCEFGHLSKSICSNVLFLVAGYNPEQMVVDNLPVIMAHSPAGSSTKQFLHYAQLINSGYFHQYDYGYLPNKFRYGTFNPPEYDLSKVTAPVALQYSLNDVLAAEEDVLNLFFNLGNPVGLFLVADKRFSHLDYQFGKDADKFSYETIFNLMKMY